MKKAIALIIFTFAVSSVALADASPTGCLHSGGQAAGCDPVAMPEPSALPELALVLAGLGFVAIRQRKNAQAK